MLTTLRRAGRRQQSIDRRRPDLQQLLPWIRIDLPMAMALQSNHQCGQYRRQAFTAEMVTRLPERLQQLHHLGAITAAPANLS